jgi:nicotinamidase-related amidase
MNKVLIVVDMQIDFIDGSLGTKEAKAIVPRVCEKIEAHEGKIMVTYDTHHEDYLRTIEGEKLPVPHCMEGDEGWELNPIITAALADKDTEHFTKPTFGSRRLAEHIAELNEHSPIESIELIGLCTDICVISNAILLKAFLPNVPISVDSKCCAGVTPESHRRALDAMAVCHIDIL